MRPALVCFTLASATLMLTACTTFRVVSKRPLQSPSGHAMQSSDHMQLKINFSEPVDRSTVVPGKTFILTTENHDHVRGSLYWSADGRSLTFRSRKTLKELFTFDPDGHFHVRIIGTDAGNGAVRDRDGELLDGDDDNLPGGNYDAALVISG
jgi:hypothetical protein